MAIISASADVKDLTGFENQHTKTGQLFNAVYLGIHGHW